MARTIFNNTQLPSDVTKKGNTFNGISQLVQTDSSGKLPIIDGSNLTNLSSSGNFVSLSALLYTATWDAGTTISGSENITGITQLSNGNILVIRTGYGSGKVQESTDNGATWGSEILIASGIDANGITQLSNGDILVTGSAGKVYKSTDNGATWDAGTTIVSFATFTGITQLSNGNILICRNSGQVYKSTDNGATWDAGTTIASGLAANGITQLSNGDILVVGGLSSAGKVYKSTDNGATWDAGTTIAGGFENIIGITQLSNGDILVTGITFNKVYKSTDNGATWDAGTTIAAGSPTLNGIIQLSNGNILVTGYDSRKIYKSIPLTGGITVAETSSQTMGIATLIGGTITVNTARTTTNSRIFLTIQSPGGTLGSVYISARTPGTSFTITSSSALDTSVVAWIIIEPTGT